MLELQLRLRRSEARHRHAVRWSGDVVQAAGAEEADGIGGSAVLAADADLEVRVRSAAALRAELHQLPDALLVDRLERVLLQDFLVDVLRQERAGVVARVAERHLCQVVRAEREETPRLAPLCGRAR